VKLAEWGGNYDGDVGNANEMKMITPKDLKTTQSVFQPTISATRAGMAGFMASSRKPDRHVERFLLAGEFQRR